jgi:hypothetical protein
MFLYFAFFLILFISLSKLSRVELQNQRLMLFAFWNVLPNCFPVFSIVCTATSNWWVTYVLCLLKLVTVIVMKQNLIAYLWPDITKNWTFVSCLLINLVSSCLLAFFFYALTLKFSLLNTILIFSLYGLFVKSRLQFLKQLLCIFFSRHFPFKLHYSCCKGLLCWMISLHLCLLLT